MVKIYVLTHLGLGDMVTTIGMVRYLSTIYDEVLLASKHRRETELLYADNDKIKIREVSNDHDARICPIGYILMASGIHLGSNTHDVPFSFYRDIGIDERYFWTYFYIPDTDISQQLYDKMNGREYIVIHNNTSQGKVFSVDSAIKHYNRNCEVIDLNSHPDFAMKPLVYYKDLLINASGLYLTDSCIFCLAINLELKTDHCYYVSRRGKCYNYLYDRIGGLNRKKFTQLTLT